jgi:adenylate cyclase
LIGEAHFFKREFGEAASKLLLSVQENPGYPHSYRVLAACYVHMGRLDEARAITAGLRRITPRLVPSAAQLRNPADRELFLSGLRVAADDAN